jgi:hypothetical protein
MIYHNPKNLIEKYLKKVTLAEQNRIDNNLVIIQQVMQDKMSMIKRKEDSVKYEKLENAFVAEYLRRLHKKSNKSSFKSIKKTPSQNSIRSSSIEKHHLSGVSEIANTPSSLNSFNPNKTDPNTPSSKDPNIKIRNNSLPAIKNNPKMTPHIINEEKTDKEDLKFSKPKKSENFIDTKSKDHAEQQYWKNKIRIIPKEKNKAMDFYYKSHVKPNFSPEINQAKNIELSLRSFSSEKPKSFKDFKIIKIFN